MSEARSPGSDSLLLFAKWLLPTLGMWIALALGKAWLALAFYHATIAVVVISARPWRTTVDAPGPRQSRTVVAALVLAIPVATYLLFYVASALGAFGSFSENIARVGLNNHSLPYFAVYLCLANGVLEELYWRRVGPSLTLMRVDLNDVLYAAFHVPVLAMFLSWPWILLALTSLSVGGVIWRNSASHYRTITPAVASHVAANAALWFWVWHTVQR